MKIHFSTDEQGLEIRLILRGSYAFARAVRLFKRWRKAPSPRTPGLHSGIYQVNDDFDDPLPADFLISQV